MNSRKYRDGKILNNPETMEMSTNSETPEVSNDPEKDEDVKVSKNTGNCGDVNISKHLETY